MPINAIKGSIGDEVLNQMKKQIIQGEWPVGSKIPTETELEKLFQVSRISIRQATQKLVGMGLLKIRRGDGTYVNEVSIMGQLENILPMIMLSKSDYSEIMEFRKIIEVENTRLAASRATTEELKILRQLYEHMASIDTDIQEYAKDDIAFHMQLAIATHNSFIQKITSVINDVLRKMMFSGVTTVGIKTSLSYHKKVVDAIEKRDSNAAAAAMQDHINNIINILTK